MARDNDDYSSKDKAHGFDTKPSVNRPRQEPTFSRYDEDEDYEEPDRDADYTSGFHADEVEDDDFEGDYRDGDEPDLFEDDDELNRYDDELPDDESDLDNWQDKEALFEEEEDRGQTWPLSLIAVAIVALVLLVAGGYGVMQQRTATENELRELRAALATSADPGDGRADRDALKELQQAFDALEAETQALRLENRTLSDTVAGLEAQLGDVQTMPAATSDARQAAPDTVPTPKPAEPAAAEPKAAAPVVSKPAPGSATATQPVVTAASGPWFVNFGSYAMRNVAESWAARLQPDVGKVIVMPTTSGDRTLYRLRIIGLADKESASRVARRLEADLGVSDLWVGKE